VVVLIIGYFGYTVCQETNYRVKQEATVLRCMTQKIKLDVIQGFSLE
jgi:hypothetical protein